MSKVTSHKTVLLVHTATVLRCCSHNSLMWLSQVSCCLTDHNNLGPQYSAASVHRVDASFSATSILCPRDGFVEMAAGMVRDFDTCADYSRLMLHAFIAVRSIIVGFADQSESQSRVAEELGGRWRLDWRSRGGCRGSCVRSACTPRRWRQVFHTHRNCPGAVPSVAAAPLGSCRD